MKQFSSGMVCQHCWKILCTWLDTNNSFWVRGHNDSNTFWSVSPPPLSPFERITCRTREIWEMSIMFLRAKNRGSDWLHCKWHKSTFRDFRRSRSPLQLRGSRNEPSRKEIRSTCGKSSQPPKLSRKSNKLSKYTSERGFLSEVPPPYWFLQVSCERNSTWL